MKIFRHWNRFMTLARIFVQLLEIVTFRWYNTKVDYVSILSMIISPLMKERKALSTFLAWWIKITCVKKLLESILYYLYLVESLEDTMGKWKRLSFLIDMIHRHYFKILYVSSYSNLIENYYSFFYKKLQ